jgi:two-component system, OmpR family, response regulator
MNHLFQNSNAGRILIVDDNVTVLSSVTEHLKNAGYDVVATDRTVGIAKHIVGCDLVIIDYHMPGIDGQDVLKSLRRATEGSATAPLLYLYTSNDEVARRARQLGFDGAFFDKGSGPRLVEQVSAALRLQRLRGRR